MNIAQFPILHDEVKDTLIPTMNDMNMDWLMLIRVEIEDKPEVFKYLWHSNIICYFIDKDITISLKYQNSFKQMSDRRLMRSHENYFSGNIDH